MKKKRKVDFGAYAFLIPAAVIYLSVIVVPVFYSLFISLFKWNGVAEKEFVGLSNYINLFTNDATFMIALKNNLIWIVLTIVLLMTVSLGFAVILNKQFLAGLQSVSPDVLEAATIDGAGPIRKFFSVTVPLMKETFVMVLATLIVAAMKVFDIVQGLTGGGPNNSTQVLATYMYSQTFQYNNVGMGTAVACVMVVMMLVVIIPYISFTAKEK